MEMCLICIFVILSLVSDVFIDYLDRISGELHETR